MNITIVSPYHSGSHRAWAEGYQKESSHQVELLTMPGRFWKWRMHGAAITLARRFKQSAFKPDLILATDMLDLTTFLALLGHKSTPAVLYMHENQLTYPLPQDAESGPMRRQKGERDLHYAFINVASMAAAVAVYFNSHFHQRSFFNALPNFLKHFPDFNELSLIDDLQAKSAVLPVGIDLGRLGAADFSTPASPPLILWNQRWEYDKNPASFFQTLYALADQGIQFRLALCGENFRRRPQEFDQAQTRLAGQIVHFGYANEQKYRQLLWQADLTVSTAHHEFFGISILEAIHCQTLPILPERLSYPELIPAEFHNSCLYENSAELRQKLTRALQNPEQSRATARQLAMTAGKFSWQQLAGVYDHQLSQTANAGHSCRQ